jgi:hypothetical protein
MKLPLIVPHYSRKILLCASVLLLFATVAPSARAADDYAVDNVVVDAEGRDTTDARTKAQAAGEKDAFSQLILKLNPSNAKDIFAHVTPAEVSAMVHSFSITQEKMTANHYHAIMNYSFDPRQVQALLPPPAPPAGMPATTPGAATLPATPASVTAPAAPERARKAVLVLPVYNDNGALSLWQDDNKWRNVWYEAALESGGGLVVVPLGDINDRVDVDDGNVNAATTDSLKRMYDRYGVGQIIVASALFNQRADPKPALEVTLRKLTPGSSETMQMSYTIHSTENLDALLLRASIDIARTLYKQQTIDPNRIEYDRLKEINARVNTTNIKEWQELRQRLLMRGNIVEVKFVSISYYETIMTITFKGTADMLGKTLVASGLRVMQDGDSLVLAIK